MAKVRMGFLIFSVVMETCMGRLSVEVPDSKRSVDLIETTGKVLSACREDRGVALGLAGNIPSSLIISLQSSEEKLFPLILLNDKTKSMKTEQFTKFHKQKLQIFGIAVSTQWELNTTLSAIKNSQWWNHEAYFYIINFPTNSTNDCSQAFEFLWTAWKMDLLEVIFLCSHSVKGIAIYSFNPYSNNAPAPWEEDTIYMPTDAKNYQHPWTLLIRKPLKDSKICEKMNFKKTGTIGGYEIRVTVNTDIIRIKLNTNKTGVEVLGGEEGKLFNDVLQSMNASGKVIMYGKNYDAEYVGEDGTAHGPLMDLASGVADIRYLEMDHLAATRLASTYPHGYEGLCILTQYQGDKSQFSKVISAIDLSSRYVLGVACLANILVLKFILRQTSMIATLNTLRMICNSCFTTLPMKNSARIYLCGLLFLVVTLQGIYQGQLSALLAKSIPKPDVDSWDDLVKSKLTVYGIHIFQIYLYDNHFDGRYVSTDSEDCSNYVVDNSSIACLSPRPLLILAAAKTDLHISKDNIFNIACSFSIRPNWPLEHRFNEAFQRLFEGNIIEYSYYRALRKEMSILKIRDDSKKDTVFKILALADLNFAFVILAYGLAFAFVTFAVEVGFEKIRKLKKAKILVTRRAGDRVINRM